MNPTPHVALIGACIAGLSCAVQLQQAGLEVSLFERSRGAGGRMSTRRCEDWQCDHGAQYFTARHPDFRAEVARWQQAGVAALWDPRLWLFDGDSPAGRESTVERFVGMPAMTTPARHLADKLRVHAPAGIRQLKRQTQGRQLLSAAHGSDNLISRILRSTELEDQAEVGAWEDGLGRVQLVTECAGGAVGDGIGLMVEANG